VYIPRNFHINNDQQIFRFIEQNSFGQLISNVNGGIFSTHIPVMVSKDRKSIFAHIAKANPQHKELDGQEVLVTLEGPHGYISPSWYENPGVPTWNYQAVHIYGQAKIFNGRERLMHLIETLTMKYEKAFSDPWKPAYNEVMLNAIVGIELEISEIQCKFKLGQNREKNDIARAVKELTASGAAALAEAMEVHCL
jgi:transcriptional regulator